MDLTKTPYIEGLEQRDAAIYNEFMALKATGAKSCNIREILRKKYGFYSNTTVYTCIKRHLKRIGK